MIDLSPPCEAHDGMRHQPARCEDCGLHPAVCKPKPKVEVERSPGTHLGRLDQWARERRAIKNARNRKNREARAK